MPRGDKKRSISVKRKIRAEINKLTPNEIAKLMRKSSSGKNTRRRSSSPKKLHAGPGKSAQFRGPKFHKPEDYITESFLPTDSELRANPKLYLDDYEVAKLYSPKSKDKDKELEVRYVTDGRNYRVKIFRYNGNEYTHPSMTHDGLQKMVKDKPKQFKEGDVILMETPEEQEQLYLVGKKQKLVIAHNILAIFLDFIQESRSVIDSLTEQFPGNYEPIRQKIEDALSNAGII